LHETDEPDLVVDLLDPDILTGEYGAEVDRVTVTVLSWSG
jgi:hypothetical protein